MSGIVDTLVAGGPIVGILIALSVFSLTLIAVKVTQLRAVLSGSKQRSEAFNLWSGGDRVAALKIVEGGRSPADRITREAMTGLIAGRRRPVLEGDLEWKGNAEVARMNRHIRLLELIAMVSPLLGLLGTVLGMIRSFQELAAAQGAANASVLAGGIWLALLTTAAGLIVAIPATIAAALLTTRVESASHMIEASVGELFAIEDDRH